MTGMSTMNTLTSSNEGWFKSSLSNGNQSCVEVRFDQGSVLIRDSKYAGDPASQPVITVDAENWLAFLDAALESATEAPAGLPTIERATDGSVRLRAADGAVLTYTHAEWHAFAEGVAAGEFSPVPV